MTRSDFEAVGFTYHPPAGDQLRWRMEDVRVYCYAQTPADGQHLYALWSVGESSYLLSTTPNVYNDKAVLARLPMHDAARLRLAIVTFFETHNQA